MRRDLTKFAFCAVLVIFFNYDATNCDTKSNRAVLSSYSKQMDDRKRTYAENPSAYSVHKLANTTQDKKVRALRMPQMDNAIFFIVGVIHSTLQSFMMQLQTTMQFGVLMMAGMGLRNFLNNRRNSEDGIIGSINRMLQVDNGPGITTAAPPTAAPAPAPAPAPIVINSIPAFRPIDFVAFNRYPSDYSQLAHNFNTLASNTANNFNSLASHTADSFNPIANLANGFNAAANNIANSYNPTANHIAHSYNPTANNIASGYYNPTTNSIASNLIPSANNIGSSFNPMLGNTNSLPSGALNDPRFTNFYTANHNNRLDRVNSNTGAGLTFNNANLG